MQDPNGEGKWLVILNSSLAESEIHRLLRSQQHKIRVSTGTVPNTCIFPQSSAAFMVVAVSDVLTSWPPAKTCQFDATFSQRLIKFSKIHQKCYVLLCAPMLGVNEQKVLSALQERYLPYGLHFLPVHNSNECVQCMMTIAKVMCKPVSTLIHERFKRVQEQLLSEEGILSIVDQVGLKELETLLLLDGCGSLASIAQASVDNLMEFSLDNSAALHVQNLLHTK